jgi:cytochrome c oxidase subunit 2
MPGFPLFPERASTMAARVDLLYFALIGLSGLIFIGVALLMLYFAVRYRRGSHADRSGAVATHPTLEYTWIGALLILSMGTFVWAARIYFDIRRPPANALEVYAVGKQWMWKFQHAEGQGEIDELHVPAGRPVRLIMTSQDVIHSFYVPAFRIKMDVLPGRYTTTWFEATQTGEYHLFCAEYCGAQHSGMIGRVIVMEPAAYEQWLSIGSSSAYPLLSVAGQPLFQQLGCGGCHVASGTGVGPSLVGLFGTQVELQDGQSVTADEDYIRESILEPNAKVTAGHQPIMPSFQGQVTEEQLSQLIEYIKSLRQGE